MSAILCNRQRAADNLAAAMLKLRSQRASRTAAVVTQLAVTVMPVCLAGTALKQAHASLASAFAQMESAVVAAGQR